MHRLVFLVPALILYSGIILYAFHVPISQETVEDGPDSELLLYILLAWWLAANYVIVAKGNLIIGLVVCIVTWWIAQRLYFPPSSTYKDDDSLAAILPTFFGFINVFLLGFIFVVVEFRESARRRKRSEPGASQSAP